MRGHGGSLIDCRWQTSQTLQAHTEVLKARARGLGSGLQDPRAGPWACQSRHQGRAGLRLLGLGYPGFRALSRAVHITTYCPC